MQSRRIHTECEHHKWLWACYIMREVILRFGTPFVEILKVIFSQRLFDPKVLWRQSCHWRTWGRGRVVGDEDGVEGACDTRQTARQLKDGEEDSAQGRRQQPKDGLGVGGGGRWEGAQTDLQEESGVEHWWWVGVPISSLPSSFTHSFTFCPVCGPTSFSLDSTFWHSFHWPRVPITFQFKAISRLAARACDVTLCSRPYLPACLLTAGSGNQCWERERDDSWGHEVDMYINRRTDTSIADQTDR